MNPPPPPEPSPPFHGPPMHALFGVLQLVPTLPRVPL